MSDMWVIRNTDEQDEWPLYWSNTFGWTYRDFDVFSDHEKHTLRLPFDGEWMKFDHNMIGE
jgi:hypothetical protein